MERSNLEHPIILAAGVVVDGAAEVVEVEEAEIGTTATNETIVIGVIGVIDETEVRFHH